MSASFSPVHGRSLVTRPSPGRVRPGWNSAVSLVDNFGSLFIALGLVILQVTPWFFSGVVAGVSQPLLYGGFAIVYWALAEFFVRGPRRLPATVAALLFAYDGFQAVARSLFDLSGGWNPLVIEDPVALATIAGLLALALARFRLPLLVLALTLTLIALAFRLFDEPTLWLPAGCGLALLAGGIALDLCDPERKRPWHEWALWLFAAVADSGCAPPFTSTSRLSGERLVPVDRIERSRQLQPSRFRVDGSLFGE